VRFREALRARLLDWAMGQMDELRAPTLARAEGEVLEVGFGTGRNLSLYGAGVKSVTGVDPHPHEGFEALEARLARSPFPVVRSALPADRGLPFDAGRFDCAVTTWTLCSIRDAGAALAEMHRVLRPGGLYVFIEHGLAPDPRTARWQQRLNPAWRRFADGCNMNRPIDRLVEASGFRLAELERFRHKGPGVLAHMYRGVAERI
jgi:SAM-dependent methyltransferase